MKKDTNYSDNDYDTYHDVQMKSDQGSSFGGADRPSRGGVMGPEKRIEVSSVSTGATVMAETVEVRSIDSGGTVIAENVVGLKSVSSGGLIICNDVDDDGYNGTVSGAGIHSTFESAIEYYEEKKAGARNRMLVDAVEDDIEELQAAKEVVEDSSIEITNTVSKPDTSNEWEDEWDEPEDEEKSEIESVKDKWLGGDITIEEFEEELDELLWEKEQKEALSLNE